MLDFTPKKNENETAHEYRERALRSQVELLERSLDASSSGLLIVDCKAEDLPIVYVNPSFERITGYTANEVLGRNCRFLQGDERDQPALAKLRTALDEREEARVVLKNFRKDGSVFWNNLYITPVACEKNDEVTHYIGVIEDISGQKRQEADLAHNISHDLLTGLVNRSLLEERIRQACQIALRYNRRLALLFVDLDAFKPINTVQGHGTGDQLLIEVARRIEKQVRGGDTVARLGSDEFVVLLPDLAREEDVIPVTERIMQCIAKPYFIDGEELRVTASIGVTLSKGLTDKPAELIIQANSAMHEAKRQGQNNYQWYTKGLDQQTNERINIRSALQNAIENQDLQLHYQPQIDARTNRVTGFEALCRWQHPELGNIPPDRFIPVAEDTGQIIPLSEWMLETACRQNGALCRELRTNYVVSVNISPAHFLRVNFVDSIIEVLAQTDSPAELLELEITETILFNDPARAVATLHRLKKLGVHLSIDDFGTGFSSLNYLKLLPVDKIKIDRSFVKDIVSDPHDAAITQGIISMAHHLKLRVTAEGIETEPQRAFLKRNYCDEFQGYMFAKPMPYPELVKFLKDYRGASVDEATAHSGENPQQTLLLVDDEENILRALSRILRRQGYRVLQAGSAQQAFDLLALHEVQVILSDQRMPEMTGTEFFSHVKDLYPRTVRIILSGYTDLKSVTEAINQGAIYKFLTKPWDDETLRMTIAQAFEQAKQSEQ